MQYLTHIKKHIAIERFGNMPLLFLVHCTLTTVTLSLMELASSTASTFSINKDCRENLWSYTK